MWRNITSQQYLSFYGIKKRPFYFNSVRKASIRQDRKELLIIQWKNVMQIILFQMQCWDTFCEDFKMNRTEPEMYSVLVESWSARDLKRILKLFTLKSCFKISASCRDGLALYNGRLIQLSRNNCHICKLVSATRHQEAFWVSPITDRP